MPDTISPRLAELRQHEEELVFPQFDHHDAWRLGSLIANHAIAEGHGVAIDIRRHNIVLFRCVLPGATADRAGGLHLGWRVFPYPRPSHGRRRRSFGVRAVL
jgi:uncharacterized protein (UPF0303 family)